MKPKVIVAVVIIVGALLFGATTFLESNIEYMDFAKAQSASKKVQVKGKWVKEKNSQYDATKSQFTFYMVDDNQQEVKVVLDGAKPNNFEMATEVIAKGRFIDGY
ncbi:MAG: cytochrome c maturation protein CcmE, partial [Bacteroidota bacterium]|nr:cytochrome c maturation protein CcmE [Bacteroidota bacterium]